MMKVGEDCQQRVQALGRDGVELLVPMHSIQLELLMMKQADTLEKMVPTVASLNQRPQARSNQKRSGGLDNHTEPQGRDVEHQDLVARPGAVEDRSHDILEVVALVQVQS